MATYFVKNGGSDAADGLSDANAWENISKVNGFSFAEGDTIQFKRGDTWTGTRLIIPRSGASGNPMTFTAYDSGAKPIIDVEGGVNQDIILTDKSYITLDNLEVKGGLQQGIAAIASGTGITIQNCTIASSGLGIWFFNQAGDSAGFDTITVKDNTFNTPGHGIEVIAIDPWTVDTFVITDNTITSTGGYGISVQCTGGGADWTVTGNTISAATGGDNAGIAIVSNPDPWTGTFTVSNNTISQSGGFGIQIFNATANVTVADNSVTNWSQNTNDRGAFHIITQSNNTVLVEDNVASGGGANYQSAGLYADTFTNVTATFRRNRISDSNGVGILIYRADNVEMSYNIIDNCGKDDAHATFHQVVLMSTAPGDTVDGNKLYNNVIYTDDNTKDIYGIFLKTEAGGTAAGNIFKNNIIYHDASARFEYIRNEDDATAVMDNNCYWPVISTNEMHYNGTDYDSFSAWQAIQDANGIETDPLMVSPASGDFHLQSTSPCIDAGVDVGLTQDFDGNVVPR